MCMDTWEGHEHVYEHTSVCVCVSLKKYVDTCVCMNVYVCEYVYVCVSVRQDGGGPSNRCVD